MVSPICWRAYALLSTLMGMLISTGVAGETEMNYPTKYMGAAGETTLEKFWRGKKVASKKLQE